MWTDQEILYAMFILKANKVFYYEQFASSLNDEIELCHFVCINYADLFSDRAVCEMSQDEIDGWIELRDSLKNFSANTRHISGGLKLI